MSFFFPQALAGSHTSYSPLFHILNDLESTSRAPSYHRRQCAPRSFTPRFDVKELADSYQLEGELPGVVQENIDIEFTDPQTLVVRGSSSYSRSTGSAPTPAPAAAVEAAPAEEKEASAESNADDDAVMVDKPAASHQATVEDETPAADAATPTTSNTVAETDKTPAPAAEQPQSRYWVSERSTGKFTRSFTFADRVDQEAVQASFSNGILSIVVPKAKIEKRKITIN